MLGSPIPASRHRFDVTSPTAVERSLSSSLSVSPALSPKTAIFSFATARHSIDAIAAAGALQTHTQSQPLSPVRSMSTLRSPLSAQAHTPAGNHAQPLPALPAYTAIRSPSQSSFALEFNRARLSQHRSTDPVYRKLGRGHSQEPVRRGSHPSPIVVQRVSISAAAVTHTHIAADVEPPAPLVCDSDSDDESHTLQHRKAIPIPIRKQSSTSLPPLAPASHPATPSASHCPPPFDLDTCDNECSIALPPQKLSCSPPIMGTAVAQIMHRPISRMPSTGAAAAVAGIGETLSPTAAPRLLPALAHVKPLLPTAGGVLMNESVINGLSRRPPSPDAAISAVDIAEAEDRPLTPAEKPSLQELILAAEKQQQQERLLSGACPERTTVEGNGSRECGCETSMAELVQSKLEDIRSPRPMSMQAAAAAARSIRASLCIDAHAAKKNSSDVAADVAVDHSHLRNVSVSVQGSPIASTDVQLTDTDVVQSPLMLSSKHSPTHLVHQDHSQSVVCKLEPVIDAVPSQLLPLDLLTLSSAFAACESQPIERARSFSNASPPAASRQRTLSSAHLSSMPVSPMSPAYISPSLSIMHTSSAVSKSASFSTASVSATTSSSSSSSSTSTCACVSHSVSLDPISNGTIGLPSCRPAPMISLPSREV